MSFRESKKVILTAEPPAGMMKRVEEAWDNAYSGAGMADLYRMVYLIIYNALPAVVEPRARPKRRPPKMAWGDLYWKAPEPKPSMFWLGKVGEL